MKEKIIEFLSFLLVIILLIVMTVSSIVLTYNINFNLKDYSYYLITVGIIGLIIYIISKIKNFKFTKIEIFIFVLMILSTLSIFTAINLDDALFGRINRREGLFDILTYYIMALNCMSIKNKKYIKIIISFICIYALINIFYGLFQIGILTSSNFEIIGSWHYARGFLGNSMYFGTLMAIFYGISIGLFIKTNELSKTIIAYILLLTSSIGIIMSGSMSVFVSTIFIYLVILFQAIVKIVKKDKDGIDQLLQLIFCVITFVLLLIISIQNNNSNVGKDISELVGESKNVSTGVVKDNYGTGRIYIWKNTIDKIVENKGIGVGIDNFYNAFEGQLIDVKSNMPVDKAHNDYLQKMLCEGVISGIAFIAFLSIIFFKNIRKNLSPVYYGLFLAFTSYSVQAFFNISVTRVAPIYFVIIGLLIGEEYQKVSLSEKTSKNVKKSKKAI